MTESGNLAKVVRKAVDHYRAPSSPGAPFGSTPTDVWVTEQLRMLREALVEPFPAAALVEDGTARRVMIVANDRAGSFVVYDPTEEGEFALALGEVSSLRIDGPRGDPVGCFLAR